jgi:hypothetical protein
MSKKCPANTICIENYTFLFFGIIILGVLLLFYINKSKNNNLSNENIYSSNIVYKNNDIHERKDYSNINPIKNNDNSVLLNPHTPPLKKTEAYLYREKDDIRRMPINIKTQAFDSEYSQIGILTRVNGDETILPLMGKKINIGRDKWNYYTMNDKNNMIKLPIKYKNKKCMGDIGCENIYTGDLVEVEGYNDIFKATIYDNDSFQYIPYL